MNERRKTIEKSLFLDFQFVGPSIRSFSPLASQSIPLVSGGAGIVVAAFQSQACAAIAARKRPVLHQLSRPNGWPRQPLRLTAFSLSFSLSPIVSLSLSARSPLLHRPLDPSASWSVEEGGIIRWKEVGSTTQGFNNAGRKDETHRHPRRLPIGRARFLR